MTDVLHDLLREQLLVVLCGTAAGTTSAAARAYYAHKQNKFWKVLHATGLTPEQLQPHQYRDLLQHRIERLRVRWIEGKLVPVSVPAKASLRQQPVCGSLLRSTNRADP